MHFETNPLGRARKPRIRDSWRLLVPLVVVGCSVASSGAPEGAGSLRPAPDAAVVTSAITPPCAALGGAIDVARDRAITASSTDPTAGLGPEALVDGEPETEWVSGSRPRVVIEVDLGQVYELQRVELLWGDVYARRVGVRGSVDGRFRGWIGRSDETDGGEDVVAVGGSARWVRIVIQRPSERAGFTLRSLRVFGREGAPPTVPEALEATATAPTVVELRWAAASDDSGLLGYGVYRDEALIGTTCCPRFSDAGATPGATHEYAVTAIDVFLNESDVSEPASVTPDPGLGPLLANGDFEAGAGASPTDWATGGFQPALATFAWEPGIGLGGTQGVRILHPVGAPNDTWWFQQVPLVPGGHYNLVGWTRGESIAGGATGANLAVFGGFVHSSDAGSTGTFDWTEVAVTFEADASGTTPLQARLGFFGSTVTGEAFFDDLAVPADTFASSPLSRHMDVVIERADAELIDPASLECWVDHLDDAYDAYRDLVGSSPLSDPLQGDPVQQVLSVRQFPGGLAVAGNPIRWFHPFVAPELERIEANDDWSFAIVHELSHVFDLDYRWVFEAELSANFKLVFVIERLGGRVRARNVYYEGAELRDFFELRYQEAIAAGDFQWDAITHRMLEMTEVFGWQPVRLTYRDFLALAPGELPATALETFDLFLDRLSVHAGFEVRTLWEPAELAWVADQLGP